MTKGYYLKKKPNKQTRIKTRHKEQNSNTIVPLVFLPSLGIFIVHILHLLGHRGDILNRILSFCVEHKDSITK